MTRRCALTGKTSGKGNKVSHAKNRSIRRFHVNSQMERVHSEILNRNFRFILSARALRTIDYKGGFDAYLVGISKKILTPDLQRLQKLVKEKLEAKVAIS